MTRGLAIAALALALAGCLHHSAYNAPGIVHLEAPPGHENGDPSLYLEPEDPGEHELYLAPGLSLGPGAGRALPGHDDVGFELAVQVRAAYSTFARSRTSKAFPFPAPGWAMTLGWAPLQTASKTDPDPLTAMKDVDAYLGPVYVELERQWYLASVGVGAALYPDRWDGGGQLTVAFRPYGLRMRYTADGGFEVLAAFQLEVPMAINWSR